MNIRSYKNQIFILIFIIILFLIVVVNKILYYTCTLNKLIYIKKIFPEEKYNLIKSECEKLFYLLKPEEGSSAINRLVYYIEPNNIIYDIFYDKTFILQLSNILNINIIPSENVFIELRKYIIGSKMDWHSDSIVSKNYCNCPQIEMVFTLINESDCVFEYIDNKNNLHKIKTENNSIVLLQGDSLVHRITEVTKGFRYIIKVAYDVL